MKFMGNSISLTFYINAGTTPIFTKLFFRSVTSVLLRKSTHDEIHKIELFQCD